MSNRDEVNDMLFGGASKAFPFEHLGDRVEGEIVNMVKRQQTSIDDNKPQFWDDGNPKMMLVITLETDIRTDDDDDGLRSVYLRGGKFAVAEGKGASSLTAVRDAVKRAGAQEPGIEVGGRLAIAWTGNGPSKRGFSAPKLYTATYQPPSKAIDMDEMA